MLWWAIGFGCQADDFPLVEARGGGAGYWPSHTVTAVEGAIALAFASLELDITLTQDGVWVVQGGEKWVDCIDLETNQPPEPPTVADWTLPLARERLRCGGTPNPAHPNALLTADRPLGLLGLLTRLRNGSVPAQRIHLHLWIPDSIAPLAPVELLLDTWADAELPNPLWVSTGDLDTVALVKAEGRTRAISVGTILRLAAEVEPDLAVVAERLTPELWDELDNTAVDGLALPVEAWTGRLRRVAARNGIERVALDADDPEAWPPGLSIVLTSYPGDLPR